MFCVCFEVLSCGVDVEDTQKDTHLEHYVCTIPRALNLYFAPSHTNTHQNTPTHTNTNTHRVLWVAAHYLELPSLLDDTWSVLLGCVDDAVCRGVDKQEADGHTRQLAASARDGLLLKRFAAPQLVSE